MIDLGNFDCLVIYFVLHGAKKIVALEPPPNAAKCAKENVNISGLAERAKIANAILGSLAALGSVQLRH